MRRLVWPVAWLLALALGWTGAGPPAALGWLSLVLSPVGCGGLFRASVRQNGAAVIGALVGLGTVAFVWLARSPSGGRRGAQPTKTAAALATPSPAGS